MRDTIVLGKLGFNHGITIQPAEPLQMLTVCTPMTLARPSKDAKSCQYLKSYTTMSGVSLQGHFCKLVTYYYFKGTTHNFHLGLLPEIERVWLAIDAQLVLWDYVEG